MNKFYTYFLIIINICFISMVGLLRRDDKSDSIVFSIIPVLICIIILLFEKKRFKPFENRKIIIFDIALTGLFILMMSLEDVLKTMRVMGAEPFNYVFKIVFFPILIASLMIDVDYALQMGSDTHERLYDDNDTGDVKASKEDGKFLGIYYPVWVLICVTFAFVIAYYPGLMNSDFEKEWIWGEGPTKWSDWHTVGFLFFVKLCTFMTKKPFMITVGQALMYYLTANYTVGVLNRRFPKRRYIGWIYISLYICFGFYSCMYISQIQKNNCSTPMTLAFAVSLIDYILSKEHTKREYINMTVCAFLASAFRHSLLEIVIITLVILAVSELFDKKTDRIKNVRSLCIVIAATLGMFLVMTEGIGFGLLKAERNPAYIKYTVPMNLAASMAYRSRETGLHIDEQIVEKMEQIIPMEKWAEYYCPYDADTTDRPWHEIGDNVLKLNDPKIGRDIIEVNLYYLLHYPKQFVLSFFDVNSIVWEISEASDLVMYSPSVAYEHYEIHHMRKGEFYYLAESVKTFLASTAIGRALVYRGGFYLYLMAVITIVLFRKRQFRVFLAMLPVLLYAAALMISIPQEGSHYVMVFPLFAALFGVISCLL